MIKKCLPFALLIALLFAAEVRCAPEDKDIVIDATSNVFQCEAGTTMFFGHFGQYYVQGSGCGGAGSKEDYAYAGTPEAGTVFRWTVIKFKPGQKKIVAEDLRFFYAESHEPIEIPPRREDHWLYEVHLSLGPRLLFSKEAIPDQALTVEPFDAGDGITMYAAGDVDTLYYFIRSRPKWIPGKGGVLPLVNKVPYHYQSIKGIELTEAQYMTIACEMVDTDKCNQRLEEDAPGLNAEQIAYLRTARAAR